MSAQTGSSGVMDQLSHTIANGLIQSYRDVGRRIHGLAADLSEEQFWTKPYGYGNSFGHLTLHLMGNLHYYVGAEIAGSGYVRDRDREFTETAPPTKAEALRRLDDALDLVVATLQLQTTAMWSQEYEAVGAADFIKDRFSMLLRCATHCHHHLGQMNLSIEGISKVRRRTLGFGPWTPGLGLDDLPNPSGRPLPGEYAPYARDDIEQVTGNDAIEALEVAATSTFALLESLDEEAIRGVSYASGKWTIKEVVGHLADDERIFAYRALCIARGDSRPLAGFDEKTYVQFATFERHSYPQLLADYRAVREASLTFFSGLSAESWLRSGTVNGYPASVRGLAFHIAGHELHHVRILRERYLPLLR